jgi:eukaryotic-like serine/threonine-protein kinase
LAGRAARETMTLERWSDVARLYHAAASRDAAERAAFLADACAGDDALRHEIESLLAQESSAEGFLSAPALVSSMLDIGPSFIGRQLGPYTIHALVGAGGMGEVYRAHDGRLARDVAIKILPSAFTKDQGRLSRFEREARILASLNHPHIGAIYGLEDADGVLALVLELVDGETLADRLTKGPLSVLEALAIGRQIADALGAAHEKGIVHRDLKPANIKITPAGIVKVLDFGLARSDAVVSRADLVHVPGAQGAATSEGMVLGTAPYMSPEQARGKPADKRTDIWAFGCVLYEMLTGRAPFTGETLSDTLAAILERDPDWRLLPAGTSTALRRLLGRCLQKDPTRRLHDIADARLDLEDAASACASAAGEGPADRHRSWTRERTAWLIALVSLVVSLVTIGIVRLYVYRPTPAGATWTFPVPPPEGGAFSRASNGQMVAVSPDGRTVAFLAVVPGGKQKIWLRSRDALEAWPLPGTEGAEGPFWKPDSQSLGFFAWGQMKTVSVGGGPSQTVCNVTGATAHATWNQAGDILFAADQRGVGGLRHVSAGGGTVVSETTVERTRGETGHLWPYFLPDGRHYLYVVTGEDGGGIYIGSLGAKHGRRLLDFSKTGGTSSVAYAAPGYVLFVLGGTLMAQPFDAARLEKAGEPLHVAEGVLNNAAGTGGAFSVSADSVLAYWGGSAMDTSRLAWFARDGIETATAMKVDNYGRLSLDPDGGRAAVEHVSASGSTAIWLLDLMQGTTTQFTSDAFSIWPIWSADGADVFFASMRDGALAPYRQSVSAREDAQRLFTTNAPTTVTDSSVDRTILYQTGNFPRDDIGVLALSKGTPPRLLLHTANGVSDGHLSPDGRWMAYVSSGEIYVTSFPDAAGPWRISTKGGSQPRWGRNGMELYYLAPTDRKVMAVKVTTTPTFTHGPPVSLFDTVADNYAVTRDGRRFLLAIPTGEKHVSPPMTVVINWQEELKQRVPTR